MLLYADLRSQFEREPNDVEAKIGEEFKLQCRPPKGSPKPEIYWLKDGQRVVTSPDIYVSPVNGDVIAIVRSSTDAGNFTCVATNVAGQKKSHTAQVQISMPKGTF